MPIEIKQPPLCGMMEKPLDVLKRLGLAAEGTMGATLEEMQPYADILVTGHAPSMVDGMRMNPAAIDEEFREKSVQMWLDYVDLVTHFPRLTQVNIHFGPVLWIEEPQKRGNHGKYELLVESIQKLADYAAPMGKEIVLENHARYWTGLPADARGADVDWSKRNAYFGTSSEEWVRICEDVARPNVGLCLDTSHATTYVHTFPPEERLDQLMRFLDRSDLIRHLHWSDSYLYEEKGRVDAHAVIGKGTIPVEFHRAVKQLDAIILMETFPTVPELEEQLEFVNSL